MLRMQKTAFCTKFPSALLAINITECVFGQSPFIFVPKKIVGTTRRRFDQLYDKVAPNFICLSTDYIN